jgi:protein phosphatase
VIPGDDEREQLEPVPRERFRWGGATHAGQVRTENEDAFVAGGWLFAVADGMGGHQAGEVASALAADTLRARLHDGAPSLDVVVAAVVEANAAIFQSAHTHADQRGMGTTLTALATLRHEDGDVLDEQLALLNVGDSRTYLVRHGRLRRLTTDHSYVQELVATGHISEAEARTHPRRNIVTRALGIEPTVRIDTWVIPFVRGDRYLLCSDGLVDEVADHDIEQVAVVVHDPQAAADELVAMANRHGGRDNVTVVVVDVLDGVEAPAPTEELPIVTPVAVESEEREPWRDDSPSPLQAVPAIDGTVATARPVAARTGARGKRLAIAAAAVVVVLVGTLVAIVVKGGDDPDPAVPSTSVTTSPTTTSPTTSLTTDDSGLPTSSTAVPPSPTQSAP